MTEPWYSTFLSSLFCAAPTRKPSALRSHRSPIELEDEKRQKKNGVHCGEVIPTLGLAEGVSGVAKQTFSVTSIALQKDLGMSNAQLAFAVPPLISLPS